MTNSKLCAYKPCSQIFHKKPGEKQWGKKKFCCPDCQRKNNAEQGYLRQKAKSKILRQFTDTALQGFRNAPEIKNPKFWDKILKLDLT